MTLRGVSKYVLIALALVVSLAAFEKAQPTAEEKHASAIRHMGTSASIAASLNVDALRACKTAGVDDLERCAKLDGALLPEREAKALATVAQRQKDRYFAACTAEFSRDYCTDLFARGIEMESRRPASEETSPRQKVS